MSYLNFIYGSDSLLPIFNRFFAYAWPYFGNGSRNILLKFVHCPWIVVDQECLRYLSEAVHIKNVCFEQLAPLSCY